MTPCAVAIGIRVASLVGLTILKLLAWKDRDFGREKVAIDLFLILGNYLDVENPQRLWEEHPDIASGDDFDYERAGARLLGRDIHDVVSPETLGILIEVLVKETVSESDYGLVPGMQKGTPRPPF